jgi:hypothetical protein
VCLYVFVYMCEYVCEFGLVNMCVYVCMNMYVKSGDMH